MNNYYVMEYANNSGEINFAIGADNDPLVRSAADMKAQGWDVVAEFATMAEAEKRFRELSEAENAR